MGNEWEKDIVTGPWVSGVARVSSSWCAMAGADYLGKVRMVGQQYILVRVGRF
jgi:hypothetical protein